MTVTPFSMSRQQYPDPFLDISSTKLPKSQRKLLELLYLFATTHPQIAPIVKKLAKYPITRIIVNSEDNSDAIKKKWKGILENDLNIYETAEAMGLDFFGYGNAFITVHKPFLRFYQCKSCKHKHQAGTLKYFINNGVLVGSCKSCKKSSTFDAIDEHVKIVEEISIVRIPPQEIHIKENSLTGKAFYYRDIPGELSSAVKKHDPDRELIDTTPWIYVEAALKKKKIRFGKGKVIHLKEPALSGKDMEWGKPIIMAALKDAYLNQVYKKADESIANERVVPARFVYPQPTGNDPMRTISLSKFSGFMSKSLRRWRQDKNAVMLSPFPVGVAEVGGDAQRLSTANLRELTIKEIIGSTGVPEGFLADGMTWSGGSVQLRMLENMIMSYKRALDKLLWFVVNEVCKITDLPKVEVTFKPFRMADDIQMLQILIQLAQMKHVSFEEILDRIDLDWQNQHEKVEKETEKVQNIMVQESLLEVKSMLKGFDYQVESQSRQESYSELLGEKNQFNEATMAHLKGIQPMEEYKAQAEQQEQEAQEGQAQAEQEAQGVEQKLDNARAEMYQAKATREDTKVAPIVDNLVKRLSRMGPQEQEAQLNALRESAPSIASKVEAALQAQQQGGEEQQPEEQQQPEQQQQGGLVAELRANSSNPKEMADRIMMLPSDQKSQAFQELKSEDPQLAIAVMKELQKGYGRGKSSGGSSGVSKGDPEQKPPRGR